MGLPKDLTAAQAKLLAGETEDRPESTSIVVVGEDRTLSTKLALRQNDIVFLSFLKR